MPGNNDLNDPLFDRVRRDDAVEGIIDGLRTAIEASDEADYETIINSQHTEKVLNKLLHCAVDWADLDIQHSWHIYGADYRNDVPDPSTIQPATLDTVATPETPVVDSTERDYPTPKEFHDFYLNLQIGTMSGLAEIFSVIDEDFYTFLGQFYRQYAPPKFKELYKQNVKLQRRLSEDSSEIHVRDIDFADRRELGRTITQMHQELSSYELFDDVLPKFIEFTDLLEDVYRRFEAADYSHEFGHPPRAGIDQLERFYHRFAWKWVAELISAETATGLYASEIIRSVEDTELPGIEESYDERISQLESNLLEWNQLPAGADTFTRPQSEEFETALEHLSTPNESDTPE